MSENETADLGPETNGSDDDDQYVSMASSFQMQDKSDSPLFIDKYSVNTIDDIVYHKELYKSMLGWSDIGIAREMSENIIPENQIYQQSLDKVSDRLRELNNKRINKFKHMSNILICGHPGSGKKTFIKVLLNEIYGSTGATIEENTYIITGYGNVKKEITIQQTPYYMIIDPVKTGLDKHIIQEVVKQYAMSSNIHLENCYVPFKTIIINNVDNLPFYAQTSLRCIMSNYQHKCRFILYGYQPSKIIDALRSRCLYIRIPCPNTDELTMFLIDVCLREKININNETLQNIITKSKHNVKTCLFMLQHISQNIDFLGISWIEYLKQIVQFVHGIYKYKRKTNYSTMEEIRNVIYAVYVTNVQYTDIITELLSHFIDSSNLFPNDLFMEFLDEFAKYDVRLSMGTRVAFHIESLIVNLCALTFKYK